MKHYFKYVIPTKLIYDRLNQNHYSNLNIFLDLASVARGFFNKQVALLEIAEYSETRQPPTLFIKELKEFLGNVFNQFKQYNPKFIIFYDSGHENQNRNYCNQYKSDSGGGLNAILEDDELQLFRQIKSYYFETVSQKFNIPNVSKVIYLKNVETDYIPYYVISNNLLNAQSPSTANLILSVDKDLLQTCEYPNTFQAISVYLKSESRIDSHVYDKEDAIGYIFKNFKRGFLTAQYIPLLLALAGDKADQIPNLYKGLGFAKAIDLILKHKLPPIFNDTFELPDELDPYKKQLIRNLNLTSFELQMKRIPFDIHDKVKQGLQNL